MPTTKNYSCNLALIPMKVCMWAHGPKIREHLEFLKIIFKTMQRNRLLGIGSNFNVAYKNILGMKNYI